MQHLSENTEGPKLPLKGSSSRQQKIKAKVVSGHFTATVNIYLLSLKMQCSYFKLDSNVIYKTFKSILILFQLNNLCEIIQCWLIKTASFQFRSSASTRQLWKEKATEAPASTEELVQGYLL